MSEISSNIKQAVTIPVIVAPLHIGPKAGSKGHEYSKIVEKGIIMKLLNCFQSPVMNQTHFKDFCYRF